MLPNGELLEVVPSAGGELPDLRGFKIGYLRFLWKDGGLTEGFLIVEDGTILGAGLEHVISKREKFGEDALREIVQQIEKENIKTIEVYRSEPSLVKEFLELFPQIRVSPARMCSLKQVNDPELLLGCIKDHEGTLILNAQTAKWIVYVKEGEVVNAIQLTSDGESKEGGDAIRALVEALPSLLGNVAMEFLPTHVEKNGESSPPQANYLLYVLDILTWKPRVDGRGF